jgi:hypothetical protein
MLNHHKIVNFQRCRPRTEMFGQCSAITDPPSRVLVLENEEIDPDARDNIVLIQPQKVKLELRPGDDC